MKLHLFGLVLAITLASCQSASKPRTAGSTTKPAASATQVAVKPTVPETPATLPAGELLQPTADMAGYGVERFRIVSSPDEVIAVLANGTTVICRRVASPAVSVRGYCYTGGVFEGKWLGGGLSHLLEHLVAGGSNEKRTEQENRDLLQKIGNDSNAYTTDDHTAYFINTTTENMEAAVDLVCNWMLGAKITPEEYRREYLVVQRELEMGKGEPDRVFYYMTIANRYRVSPARVPVIGYQEVIQGLGRDDVYEYFKLAYVPNNLVFSIAGDIDPEKMLAAVKQQVKHAKPGRDFSRDIPAEPKVVSPRTLVGTFAGLGQAKLQLAFPTVQLQHEDLYALDLLATALGGGESSLFTETLRDKKELVSAVNVLSWTPSYTDGAFQIDMEVDAEKVPAATVAALELIEQIKADGVDEKRLARAKTQMRANRVKGMQTAEDVASLLAVDYMSTGDAHFNKHYVERIEKVTPEQIKAVAAKYFDKQKLLTTALLPAEFAPTLPKAEQLLRPATPATTQPAANAADGQVVKIDLDENTVLLTKRITTTPLVVMQMYSLGGLTAEDEKTNGLGNLTMQMLARGAGGKNGQEIAAFWDSIGGEFDASCGNNSWSWSATCLKDDVDKAYAMFSDLVNKPTFAESELAGVKKRVQAAIQGQDADWANQAFRFFKKSYYGPSNSPYQFMSTGTAEGVASFSIEQVRKWYAEQVLPRKKVIVVFGDVDPKAVEAMVRKAPLGRTNKPLVTGSQSTVIPEAVNNDLPRVNIDRVALNRTDQALAGIVIGYKAHTVVGEADNFPIAVGDTMASGYQYGAGYLYEILRGRGLVYVVHGQNSPGLNRGLPGTFLVYAGCEPDKVDEVVDVILENIARLQGSPADVNEDWFKRSKELIVVAEALENQTPAQQATQAALDELYGLGYNWHQSFAERIRKVTLDDVRKVAASRLANCVVTVSTPKPELVKTREGRRTYKSFPKVELTPRGIQHDAGK
jgi:zinc protease